jgi:hypothetical protein
MSGRPLWIGRIARWNPASRDSRPVTCVVTVWAQVTQARRVIRCALGDDRVRGLG